MQADGLEQLVEPTWTQRLPRTDGQQASQHVDVVCTERLLDLLLLDSAGTRRHCVGCHDVGCHDEPALSPLLE